MFVLFIVLNETEYLEDILSMFLEVGVRGATIVDSQGMAGAMSRGQVDDMPLFGSLRNFFTTAKPANKTIFTVVKDQALVDEIVKNVQSILEKHRQPGTGFMFTLPVKDIYLLK